MSENIESCCHNNECKGATAIEAPSLPVYRPHYSSRYDQDAWQVAVTLPGVKKENVSVSVENDILEVLATRNLDTPEEWTPLGSYFPERTYRLRLDVGPEVDEKQISGALEDGILSLRLPLRDEVKPRTIEIK